MACTTCAPVCPWQWGEDGERTKKKRRKKALSTHHLAVAFLPISLFYILTNHVRGRELGEGEKAFSHFCHLSCHVKLCGILFVVRVVPGVC